MDRRTFALHAAALALIGGGALAACSAQDTPAGPSVAAPQGSLAGKVTRGPTCPGPARAGEECTEPAGGVVLVARNAAGRETGRAAADAQGRYFIALPAGRYRVEIESLKGMELTKSLPAEVTVEAGAQTRLDVSIDTGMR